MNRYWYNTNTSERKTDNLIILEKGYLPSDEDLLAEGYIPLDVTMPAFDPDIYYVVDDGVEIDENKKTAKVKWVICKRDNQSIYDSLSVKLDKILSDYIDEVARSKGYDNRLSCYARAGFNSPWKDECLQFAQWAEQCYSMVYSILESIKDDKLDKIPTFAEILAMLPGPPWEIVERGESDRGVV